MRLLNYNPHLVSIDLLQKLTRGENHHAVLDQLERALRSERDRLNHQHHMIIGPRGSGKTHLLRILTGARIPGDRELNAAYFPVVMAEETNSRSPADLLLKIVERLARLASEDPSDQTAATFSRVQEICRSAISSARAVRNPLDRLEIAARTLDEVAREMDRILVLVVENLDQLLYLGASHKRKRGTEEHWALRRNLQQARRLILIAAAPVRFGAVNNPGAPFFDLFRIHELEELSNDEALDVIYRRLEVETGLPGPDAPRAARVGEILENFAEKAPLLRGALAITGGLPRYAHLVYDGIVETDVSQAMDVLNGFLDDMTPFFQARLDARVMPRVELDLLCELAMANGPLQPVELVDRLYGAPANEISELLKRLRERGLVKRAGRPGGKAVTWDLTDPLFRVWRRFRSNHTEQESYVLMAELVALFFSLDEIDADLRRLKTSLATFSTRYGRVRTVIPSREGLMAHTAVIRGEIDLEEAIDAESYSKRDNLLEELLVLSKNAPDDPYITERVRSAILSHGKSLIKQVDAKRNFDQVKAGITVLEVMAASEMDAAFHLIRLALTVLEQGHERAFAREPEEVRRVVRMIIGKSLAPAHDLKARRSKLLLEKGFEQNIEDNIRKLLDLAELGGLRNALIKRLAREGLVRNAGPRELARFLVAYDLLEAMDALTQAVDDDLAVDRDKNIKRKTIDGAASILGWLVLFAVDPDWIKAEKSDSASNDKEIRLELPAASRIGFEIVYAGINVPHARFVKTVDIYGGNPFAEMDSIAGSGRETDEILADIKRRIYKALFHVDPPLGFACRGEKNDDLLLDDAIGLRARKAEHRFLPVNMKQEGNPLANRDVMDSLQKDLPALTMVLFSNDDEQTVLRVSEHRLKEYINQFQQVAENHGLEA